MFVRRGVPAVLLMTGYANGGKAHWDAYLGKTYHSPQDDLTQKIDWDAGARYAAAQLSHRPGHGRRAAAADVARRATISAIFTIATGPRAPHDRRQP